MTTVTIRDLRNHGGEVVDRVAAGESVIVTRIRKASGRTPSGSWNGPRRHNAPGTLAQRTPRGSRALATRPRRCAGLLNMTATREAAGLLDTSTVILLPLLRDPAQLPIAPVISSITLAELSVGPHLSSDAAVRSARQSQLQQAEADFNPIPFDAAAAACIRARGR